MVIDGRAPDEIAGDPIVRQTLWLISHGVPFDIAWLLPAQQAKAWAIVLAEQANGREYDWKYDEWKERSEG